MQLSFKKPQTELGCSISDLCAAAFPVICSLLLSRLMQITDRFMLAHYSTEALNSAMVAMQAGDVLYLPILSIASISEVFVGQMNGKKTI